MRRMSLGPLDARFELQFVERERFRPARGRYELLRRGQWLGRVGLSEAVSPERREDLEGFAALVLDRPRFVQQRGVEALRLDALRAQGLRDDFVARDDCRLVTAIPEHRRRAGFLHE